MSIHNEYPKMEIKLEKQDLESQYETGDNSTTWNVRSDQDSINTSALIKKEYESEEDSKSPPINDFVTFESIYIKEEKLESQNANENNCIANQDLIDSQNIDCKSEIDIEEHPVEVKDEPINTATPQDGSTSQRVITKVKSRLYSGEKRYNCEICNTKFTQSKNLNVHMRKHTGDSSFECEICLKKLSRKSYLRIHMRIHTGERPFECEICKKKFMTKKHLMFHVQSHSGERPYDCEVCKSKFALKRSLIVHMRKHTGEKLVECEICKKKYTRKCHLDEHMRTHFSDGPFECKICKDVFTMKSQLGVHMKEHAWQFNVEGICI